jgi:hypothetical protein
VLTEGDILIDSVLRFKGRAAPCVILTEIDFDSLDDKAMRRLFVGATRATMKLTLVVSASAALLQARLEQGETDRPIHARRSARGCATKSSTSGKRPLPQVRA